MTITFPRDWPAYYIGGMAFKLRRQDLQTPDGSGKVGGVTLNFPLWQGEWDLVSLTDQQALQWESWIDSLKGQQNSFLAYDWRARYPFAYRTGTNAAFAGMGAFTGAASSWSVDTTRSILTLNGLPAGLILTVGDMVGFVWDTSKRHMVRIIEGATANGSGVAVVTVSPAVWPLVDAGAVAHLDKPCCTMRLLADTQIGDTGPVGGAPGRIVGLQYLDE